MCVLRYEFHLELISHTVCCTAANTNQPKLEFLCVMWSKLSLIIGRGGFKAPNLHITAVKIAQAR